MEYCRINAKKLSQFTSKPRKLRALWTVDDTDLTVHFARKLRALWTVDDTDLTVHFDEKED